MPKSYQGASPKTIAHRFRNGTRQERPGHESPGEANHESSGKDNNDGGFVCRRHTLSIANELRGRTNMSKRPTFLGKGEGAIANYSNKWEVIEREMIEVVSVNGAATR